MKLRRRDRTSHKRLRERKDPKDVEEHKIKVEKKGALTARFLFLARFRMLEDGLRLLRGHRKKASIVRKTFRRQCGG